MKQAILSSRKIRIGRILLILCAALFALEFTACCPCRHLADKDTHTETSSNDTTVNVREIHIIDTVYVPVPAQSASSVGETDTNGLPSSHLETDFAVSDAFVDSTGKLHHSLENKPQNIPAVVDMTVHATDTTIKQTQTTNDTHTEYVEVEKELKWWQTMFIYIGIASCVFFLGWLVWRLFLRPKFGKLFG